MLFFDPLYLLFVAPALILVLFAQHRVSSTYHQYAEVPNLQGISGWEIARRLLRATSLKHVEIEVSPGELSDHYDPTQKVLRLSPGVYQGSSVAALGIVAHEVGHALQDREGYAPMRFRASLVGAANFGTSLGPIFFFLGLMLNIAGLIWLGFIAFAGAVLFSLATLPVEHNASERAKLLLQSNGLVSVADAEGVNQVLAAAKLTYVAAALQALLTLAYFALRAFGGSREEE